MKVKILLFGRGMEIKKYVCNIFKNYQTLKYK